jgi:hypothetical protein
MQSHLAKKMVNFFMNMLKGKLRKRERNKIYFFENFQKLQNSIVLQKPVKKKYNYSNYGRTCPVPRHGPE